MGKIVKPLQLKHKETLSPWLKDYVAKVAEAPLPRIPELLSQFPSTWPFARGDLYHWIPLLNRFDNILECVVATYRLAEGPQSRDFTCEILLKQGASVEYHDDQEWTLQKLEKLGYGSGGDSELLVAILKFSSQLLEHCGNRSIYSSSSYLNDLLHTTSAAVLRATMEVGMELAQRYQASVKRINHPARSVSAALLASHYNIDLERVLQLSQPFVKTPIFNFTADPLPPTTPTPSSAKGKEKARSGSPKNVASMYANDLVSLATPESRDESRWNGWGDIKITYYPLAGSQPSAPPQQVIAERSHSTLPSTPTPLRRSSTMGPQHRSPRTDRNAAEDSSPASQPLPSSGSEDASVKSPHRTFEIPQSAVASTCIYDLLARCPEDMPKSARFELLTRLRVAKALLGSAATRQDALAVRLLAVANLAYIHPEATFLEKVLRQDNDEPRRYQLVYQLAELVTPVSDGSPGIPVWMQAIAFQLIEGIAGFPQKHSDVLSALNANVNHGVLLYVVRKAVAGLRNESETEAERIEWDQWRRSLFALLAHMSISARLGNEMLSAGIMEHVVEILSITTPAAERFHSTILGFLDGLIYNYQGAFQVFVEAKGLERVSDLTVYIVKNATVLVKSGHVTPVGYRSKAVDYEISFYSQQSLKWLLKFIHHIMTSWFSFGGNTDRLLRNFVDNSALLGSLRHIIEHMAPFGSVIWTHAVTILGDFINNDPTSFAALMESGLIKTFLESLTGRELTIAKADEPDASANDAANDASNEASHEDADNAASGSSDDEPSSPDSYAFIPFEEDTRPHPPTREILEAPRDHPLAGRILASSEAMSIIPTLFNSLSLNNEGMKMVVSSGVLDSYFEIFESASHINILESEKDLANNIGSSFDELARHHPSLRQTIGNAVLDMLKKVVYLGEQKAKLGWGVHLHVPDPSGGSIVADETLLEKAGLRAQDADQDIEMSTDSLVEAEPKAAAAADEGEPPRSGMTPYVTAVAKFLQAYIGNSTLKSNLANKGGIELLLDMSELPSLPYDFAQSYGAKILQLVISSMVEFLPVFGLPSLLNRTQAAVDTLRVLSEHQGPEPFFAPFIKGDLCLQNASGEWDRDMVKHASRGTQVVRALLVLQSLLKTLYQCYATRPGSNLGFHPVNVFDLYGNLVKSLGPLLRVALAEEVALGKTAPPFWPHRSLAPGAVPPTPSASRVQNDQASAQNEEPAPGDATPRPAGRGPLGSDTPVPAVAGSSTNAAANTATAPAADAKPPPALEAKSLPYRNHQVIQVLLHDLMPTSYPFFQGMGRALLVKRRSEQHRDPWTRAQHLWLAEVLAETILVQWKGDEELDKKELDYWVVLLHSVEQLLIDSPRGNERGYQPVIIPVLVAFKNQGGLDSLHSVLRQLAKEVSKESLDQNDPKSRLAQLAMKKILDLYLMLVNGKNIIDSIQLVNLAPRAEPQRTRDGPAVGSQLLVELRMSILPVVRELWDSPLIEKAQPGLLTRVVDILKSCFNAEPENTAYRKTDKLWPPAIFKFEKVPFDWSSNYQNVTALIERGCDPELAREAFYRCNKDMQQMETYELGHTVRHAAGARNPVPAQDAWKESSEQAVKSSEQVVKSSEQAVSSSTPPGARAFFTTEDATTPGTSDNGDDTPSHTSEAQIGAVGGSSASLTAPASANAPQTPSTAAPAAPLPAVAREDLDEERAKLREDLIDRCLDVIRAHHASVFEVADLISVAILRHGNEDSLQEVGETLANALMSFAGDDDDNKKSNAGSIAAYAHLLSILLQESKNFFRATVQTLKENVDDYLGFLKISPEGASENLPQWIAYILLIFEVLLTDDEQPVESKLPTIFDPEVVPSLTLAEKTLALSKDQNEELLNLVLELMVRVGKDDILGVAVLRVLVILTRDRRLAKTVGEKKQLQRLFVMIKQLAALGSTRLKETKINSYVLTVLRHIVEDDETVRQIMRYEIRTYFETPQRASSRSADLSNYLRVLSHVALRSPRLFIETTKEMVKLQRWLLESPDGPQRQFQLMLKETATAPAASSPSQSAQPDAKDDSVEPTVQATEDLNINEVKPTTEPGNHEMTNAPKTPGTEGKRPIVENPDGVINFLLEQLLTYVKVDDTEPIPLSLSKDKAKEPATPAAASLGGPATGASSSSASTPAASPGPSPAEEAKDKKPVRPSFKPEDHPIFIYRCFILHCLSELLQSYNRAKIEFINFKRGAPLLTNTPVKPRSTVLNYLLNDLLCYNSLTPMLDPTAHRKKLSTSDHARLLLVSLVVKTGEKPISRQARRFEEYEPSDEADLVFVRKFVLDTVLRAYRDASTSNEPFDVRYAKMLALADLMYHMIDDKDGRDGRDVFSPRGSRMHAQIKRMMYEKGYLAALTASIADIDLTFPGVKRAIKYILRVLHLLTQTATVLSQMNILPPSSDSAANDEIMSASSLSDLDDEREETPDLYRNSALGMLEPREDDDFSDDSEDDDDEEMYDEVYPDDGGYDDEVSGDDDENISDDEDELDGMGPIEGLHGEPGVVEVIMGEDEDEDESMDDDDEDDEEETSEESEDEDEDDDDAVSDDIQEIEDHIDNIVNGEGIAGDDGHDDDWESESEDDDDEEDDDDDEDEDVELGISQFDAGEGGAAEGRIHAEPGRLPSFRDLVRPGIDVDGLEDPDFANPLPRDPYDFAGDRFDQDEDVMDDEDGYGEDEDDIYLYDHMDEAPALHAGLGWDSLLVEQAGAGHRHRHGGIRSPFPVAPGIGAGHGPGAGIIDRVFRRLRSETPHANSHVGPEFRSFFRSRAPPPAASGSAEDVQHPLLRRHHHRGVGRDGLPRTIPGGMVRMPVQLPHWFGNMPDNPIAFINDVLLSLPGSMGQLPALVGQFADGLQLHVQHRGSHGEVHEVHIPLDPHGHGLSHSDIRREVYHEPHHTVAFAIGSTAERWQESARMIFGAAHHEKANRLFGVIYKKLAPLALSEHKEAKRKEAELKEEARKMREEEARKQKEQEEKERKEVEEKANREKEEAARKEAEERERAALADIISAESPAGEADEDDSSHATDDDQQPEAETQPMEGVELTGPAAADAQAPAAAAADAATGSGSGAQERVITTIRGEEVDITGLGIDPEYLAALPEEFREEVIAQTLTTRRSEARQQAETSGEQTEAFNEFLDALPEELRQEIMQQEAQERRRRDREEERRRANVNAPQEMDTASILLTFDQALRNEILIDQHEELAEHLPPEMVAQARALAERHRQPPAAAPRVREGTRGQLPPESEAVVIDPKPQRRPIVQMLDKAGVATLLRLMFIGQQQNIRTHLFGVLSDVCENRQNRLEVISTLLQILQDGSTDMEAVERSFGHLSLKARQPKDKDQNHPHQQQQKTPGSIKRALTSIGPTGGSATTIVQGNSEISPLLIVQQCLDLLVDLCRNPHIPSLFLTEHEIIGSSLRRSLSRKGKAKDLKSTRYAINSLLSLLGRDLVMESSSVMQLLADLLNKVTYPLQALERRRREAEEEEKKKAAAAAATSASSSAPASTDRASGSAANAGESRSVDAAAPSTTSDNTSAIGAAANASESTSAEPAAEGSKAQEAQASDPKKSRQLQPPVIPVHNLTLVINIFVARECSSKTFQNTISTIKNLSNIPGAKAVFGQELVRQARMLSENIVADLDDLLPHILKAETGTEIQGVALAKFSPGASEQNKLLRVLTALDHLFETKNKKSDATDDAAASEKQDLISSLYHTSTFGLMWDKLSECLSAIHQREKMVNVATILLPLIEALMVVCKNTTLSDSSGSASQSQAAAKEMLLSSPPPENRMAGLFFTFTEDHRRVLNELVRNNPKLMSGTFSLLVKNPKVLEFDNKRNYFNRSVHSKNGSQTRPSFPPLQLSVRRDFVFHDSFKSLYFKKADEMKYGKLSIRFHGEEGVDAGGVTREWFQVLSRQMFDPNYALFTPVSSDRTTFHPNKLSSINDEHLMFFKFIGRIIGKALYEGRVLDCYFSRAVYKRILGKPVSVKDMESFDPDYYKSLVWMLDNDISDIITETFAVEDDAFGVTKTVDLCPNGRDMPVTNENKHDYVRMVVEHKLLASVKDQMAEFLQGFHDIIPEDLIAIFNEQELELLISGLPDIDVDDWKGHTDYQNYTAASQQIQWFWRAVRSFDKEERAKLLQFVTGTSKVPLNGFQELEGMNGVSRFNIHRDYGNKSRLPSSHTCFNQLDLPEYESYETLRSQLLKAITAGSDYFGFA